MPMGSGNVLGPVKKKKMAPFKLLQMNDSRELAVNKVTLFHLDESDKHME